MLLIRDILNKEGSMERKQKEQGRGCKNVRHLKVAGNMKRISSSSQNQYNLIRINIKVLIYKYVHPYFIYIQKH